MNGSGVTTSIVVPSYRRADRLARLVESVVPQIAGRSDRELIVVDDASGDPGYAALTARHPEMRLLVQPANAGASAARNAGARAARGEYLLFVDDDCVAPPYWLDWFDNIVAQNPDVDLIGGHARPLPHERRLTPTRWAPDEFLRLGIWYNDDVVVLCSSCHLAVRRRWYDRIGGFREGMRWAEDRNLTYRLRRAGAIIYTDPSWHLYHESEATLCQHLRRRVGYGRGAFEQIAREWPALDRDDWPGDGTFLAAMRPRLRKQWDALPWYRRQARRVGTWSPGYMFMAAITPLAMDVGFIRARREHARRIAGTIGTEPFAVLNFGRSGSTVLGDLLHQCPGIDWGFEFFNPALAQGAGPSGTPLQGYDRLRARLLRQHAARFGFEVVLNELPTLGLDAETFVEKASADGVRSWVLLTRRNLLRQHVSLKMAMESGRFHERRSDFWRPTEPRRVRLDMSGGAGEWLVESFRAREAETDALRSVLKRHTSIELVYENDIQADPRLAIARLTPFLKLPDYDPVVRYQNAEPHALSAIIENFDEVAAVFGKTEFAWMLEG